MNAPRFSNLLAIISLLLGIVACDAGDTDGGADGGTDTAGDGTGSNAFETDIQPILNGNCLCHMEGAESMTMTAPYLTLNPGRAYDNLVGVPAEQLPSMDRVTPGDPEQSYLWHKLNGTSEDVGGSEDTQMPLGGMLDGAELELIEAWILAGAEP